MPHDTHDPSTHPQPTLADYCEFYLEEIRRPCYAPATLVLVRPSGQTLGFTCAEHAPAWAARIRGSYRVLERGEWDAAGCGYRGAMLGG
jgi:hypothetical protein